MFTLMTAKTYKKHSMVPKQIYSCFQFVYGDRAALPQHLIWNDTCETRKSVSRGTISKTWTRFKAFPDPFMHLCIHLVVSQFIYP